MGVILPTPSRLATRVSSSINIAGTIDLLPRLVLRLAPDDVDVIQTKLFLLLQTDQYARAFEIVESMSSGAGSSKSSTELEKAYLLYRLHKENEARAIVDQVKEKEGTANGGCAHLEAQIVRCMNRSTDKNLTSRPVLQTW